MSPTHNASEQAHGYVLQAQERLKHGVGQAGNAFEHARDTLHHGMEEAHDRVYQGVGEVAERVGDAAERFQQEEQRLRHNYQQRGFGQGENAVRRKVDIDPAFSNLTLSYGDSGFRVPYGIRHTWASNRPCTQQEYREATKGMPQMQKVSSVSFLR